MYLIHNAYGTLCIIKSNGSSGDKGNINEGDTEVSSLYKANNSNLFVSNVNSKSTRDRLLFRSTVVCKFF